MNEHAFLRPRKEDAEKRSVSTAEQISELRGGARHRSDGSDVVPGTNSLGIAWFLPSGVSAESLLSQSLDVLLGPAVLVVTQLVQVVPGVEASVVQIIKR